MIGFAHHYPTNYQLAPPQPKVRTAPRGVALARLDAVIRQWRDRAREREALAQMSDRELRDIGLSRTDILGELAKPFWRG
jgi:uncharacterized protein YjiS (DUF1127 family)